MTNIKKAKKYFQKKDYEKAIFYAKSVQKKITYFILAESYFATQDYENAIPYYECLLKNKIKDPWLANHLSQSYEAIGDYKSAVTAGLLSIQYAPTENAHHINFAYLLYNCKDKIAAKMWHQKYSKNPVVAHFSNALLNNAKTTDSNPEYIKEIFDNFSSSFDDVLLSLDYKAPSHIKDLLKKVNIKNAKILDLGCGTGLMGKLIKKNCKKKSLVGVDISSKMLDVCQSKHIYDHLIEADINTFLCQNKDSYNCIVASDVLTYFGDLNKLVKNIYNNTENNGYFAFSITKNNDNKKDIFLHPSGRFKHSKKYIEKTLNLNGFSTVFIEEKFIRFEGEKSIIGFIVLAQKKAL